MNKGRAFLYVAAATAVLTLLVGRTRQLRTNSHEPRITSDVREVAKCVGSLTNMPEPPSVGARIRTGAERTTFSHPTPIHGHRFADLTRVSQPPRSNLVVPPLGFEPRTCGLRVRHLFRL